VIVQWGGPSTTVWKNKRSWKKGGGSGLFQKKGYTEKGDIAVAGIVIVGA